MSDRLDLYWIPLGAGTRVVRFSGKLYEAVTAVVTRRTRCHLYHSALIAHLPDGATIVEMAPIPDGDGPRARGVVAEGPVGSRWLRRLRLFRYEVRRWQGGSVPDLLYAVASPVRITDDPMLVRRILDLVALVPTPVWGRDDLGTGDMWNCNSVISWILTQAGVATAAGPVPTGGRAPGWAAGEVAARRTPITMEMS